LEHATGSGLFVPEVVDTLVQNNRWTDLVDYLKKCVTRYAADSVIPDNGATGDGLVLVHAELFLSAHKPHVLDLLALHQDGGDARLYYDMHIRPLGLSVSQQDRRWLWNRFSDLDQIVKGLLPLPAYVTSLLSPVSCFTAAGLLIICLICLPACMLIHQPGREQTRSWY
jgi:hypothetical protein